MAKTKVNSFKGAKESVSNYSVNNERTNNKVSTIISSMSRPSDSPAIKDNSRNYLNGNSLAGNSVANLKAPSGSSLNSYIISVGKNVDPNTLLVHDNAKLLHDSMCENYNKINTYFQAIGDGFMEAANYVAGTNFQNNLKKIGNNCKAQGQYCLNRKQNLMDSFEYQPLAQKVQDLEAQIAALTAQINSQNK